MVVAPKEKDLLGLMTRCCFWKRSLINVYMFIWGVGNGSGRKLLGKCSGQFVEGFCERIVEVGHHFWLFRNLLLKSSLKQFFGASLDGQLYAQLGESLSQQISLNIIVKRYLTVRMARAKTFTGS